MKWLSSTVGTSCARPELQRRNLDHSRGQPLGLAGLQSKQKNMFVPTRLSNPPCDLGLWVPHWKQLMVACEYPFEPNGEPPFFDE